jgi:hypothetical protein
LLVHDSLRGGARSPVATSGALPAAFKEIGDRTLAQQAEAEDVDYVFDVPVDLAESATGLRYDTVEGEFAVLDRILSDRRPFRG